MALAVETPARDDLSFRDNDDKRIGARWLKSDAVTPVVIDSAELALLFDPPNDATWPLDPDTGEPITPPLEGHVIDSTTVDDPAGWINADGLAQGVVLVTVPHGIWAAYSGRRGVWDLIATGEGLQRCLVRGRFVVEQGVAL